MKKKVIKLVGILAFLQLSVFSAGGEAAVFKDKTSEKKTLLSPGVTHLQESYRTGSVYESVNLLQVNLNDPFTKLELGVPSPINGLKTTSAFARENSYFGHRVVGATNASFFHSNGYPANLLAENNEIKNYGVLGTTTESPTQNPVAFGISRSGVAIADYFSAKISFSINGKTYVADRVNGQRTANQTNLYTPPRKTTGTNEWGVEIVVEKASQKMNKLSFGDKITGVVKETTTYGVGGNKAIPADGFVLSIQNKELATELSKVTAGTPISLSISIDQKWQDAQFILAGGPLLVKDGKVNISMPTKSSFAASRHPRTAVAVDATGKNVFLVTVDGRNKGHSNGANLQDLANLLISKGAHYAVNLDGGGSTTMAVSEPGSLLPFMVNRPADGSERRVSAILQAVNIAPPGEVKTLKLNAKTIDMIVDTSTEIKASGGIDTYLNPASIAASDIKWEVTGGVGSMKGNTFTATKSGTGAIVAKLDGARAEVKVHVIDPKDKPIMLQTFEKATDWKVATAKAKASIANSSAYETEKTGRKSVKLSYDFTAAETGTKAAYVKANKSLSMIGVPDHLGVWVYGDGGKNWLRGNIVDGTGKSHTINFTNQGGLDWSGWKYVQADIPSNLPLPLTFEQIYIAQPTAALQKKGQIYFSNLQAVYEKDYKESVYVDVAKNHWAYPSIEMLNENGLIKGYPNGTFQASATITRAEAASLIARTLGLKSSQVSKFKDVPTSHFASNDIAAVAAKGIVLGREKDKFYPNDRLTRAEMATILNRAFQLDESQNKKLTFSDVKLNHWAYKNIATLVANDLTTGYEDNTFKPEKSLIRAEFAAFLDRAIGK